MQPFAICVGEVIVFSLKVIVVFWVVLFLLTKPCMVCVIPV